MTGFGLPPWGSLRPSGWSSRPHCGANRRSPEAYGHGKTRHKGLLEGATRAPAGKTHFPHSLQGKRKEGVRFGNQKGHNSPHGGKPARRPAGKGGVKDELRAHFSSNSTGRLGDSWSSLPASSRTSPGSRKPHSRFPWPLGPWPSPAP